MKWLTLRIWHLSKPGAGLLKRDSNKIKYLGMISQRFLIHDYIGIFTVVLAIEQGPTVDYNALYREEGELIASLNVWIWSIFFHGGYWVTSWAGPAHSRVWQSTVYISHLIWECVIFSTLSSRPTLDWKS